MADGPPVAKFPSAEWAERLRAAIESSEEYREAAAAWEGEVMLRVIPDDAATPPPGIRLDLAHGACRAAEFVEDGRATEAEFAFDATAADWRKVLAGEVDPVRAVLSGQVKIRGNFAKAMRFTKASTILVRIAATVPTEF